MKGLLIFITLLIPVYAQAQRVSISPASVAMWGQISKTGKISLEWHSVQAIYIQTFTTAYDEKGGVYEGGYFGLFWNPLKYEYNQISLKGGAGYMFRKFPTINGTNINFQASVSYFFEQHFGIKYSHISNGFGLFCNLNPGLDNISIVFRM